uniref:Fic family protein n=1 Tax=Prevotella sp. GTC17262 TaxID=3236797 RepID=A0AB33JKS5_9BACT
MVEFPPVIDDKSYFESILKGTEEEVSELVDKINENYEYWDSVKYKSALVGLSAEQLWTEVKVSRVKNRVTAWPRYHIWFSLTNQMQRMCHEFDMNFGGSWGADSVNNSENRGQYLVSSLMEEAIFSSQMEGAATTRKIAKDMLRKKVMPKDKSQQMIFNNYQTIEFIVAHKHQPLSVELLQEVHRLMTNDTLENQADAGRFRGNDDVVVENAITHEVVHTPPSFEEIPEFIKQLCDFFNDDKPQVFVHPIIRGIIIHFMIAYMHPFVDGNGRTARAFFYWYMLKQGYWLTEYLSISRVIAKSKKSYEKAYLYTEADNMDIGYFVAYHLRVLKQSFDQLQAYIKRKQAEKDAANRFLHIGDINERQAQIIRIFTDRTNEMLTVKDVQTRFFVTPTTAKSDIMGLVAKGILQEIALNKVKRGYVRTAEFDEIVSRHK